MSDTPLAISSLVDCVHKSELGETMKNFAERLDARMKELKISAAELSRRAGVSKAVISRMLSDPSREIRASSLISIAKQLKVDPVWLFLGRSADSLVRDIEAGPGMVPVWSINELSSNPISDAWPHADTGRKLATEREGHLIAAEADNDQLVEAGITPGSLCLIDLGDAAPEHNKIMLARLDGKCILLRAIKGLSGWLYSVDDPRAGALGEEKVELLGKVIEIRLPS
ncbi:helix-turn-helix domain-containing protein [Aeromonas simiae]|uniref:helix-turn-helix domain-containing protein n=1 Tax=Aeromonas simiae TaxID=218936 RepID=UPI00266BAEFC|nr:helix-turn-helix domain-containing protein [Aeromonas simiae]MDO2950576.1 helix-turn-helix domain-containing protein [Aeromonas simiae]